MFQRRDCTDYNSQTCPKASTIQISNFDLNNLHIGIVGCWGVYCQNGKTTMTEYKPNEDLALKDPSNLTVNDFLENEDITRGQKSVVNKMIDTFKDGLTSLFLAGDNIYSYSDISPKLIEDLERRISIWKKQYNSNKKKEELIEAFNKIFPTKSVIKKNRGKLRELYKNLFINLQLSKGFINCFRDLDVQDIFLAFGNHDIETCEIFNYQLNFDEGKYTPATYYNVVYGDLLNVFVLDTNLFEEDGKDCKGKDISEEDTQRQIDWFYSVLSKSKCKYNIVIGHIPYKCSGHKGKVIYNKNLEPIFEIISSINKDQIKVQAYFCADEHNQQLLYDLHTKCYLVVVGSGGTELDKIKPIPEEEYSKIGVKNIMNRVSFGFSSLFFSEQRLKLNIISTEGQEFEMLI